jgi:hypothetical protein
MALLNLMAIVIAVGATVFFGVQIMGELLGVPDIGASSH